MNDTKTVCCCLIKCFRLSRARDNAEREVAFDSLLDALKPRDVVLLGSMPALLSRVPVESPDSVPVTPEVISIAEKMKKEAENKLKTSFTTYTPLSYIKKGETDYCIRVKVDQLIDVSGKYCAGSVMRVKAKSVTEDDDQTFF
uniref:Uncharacterized protein n=1 Tax=Amphimedon queenslandica TaxID=400682 RepID=A0A1X7T4J4_AMPQE